MELMVLGCRSGMPSEGQASSGYLVTGGGARVLLDCGPGVATALSAVLPAGQLDAVVISHMHADHCYDLLPLGKALLYERVRAAVAGGLDPMEALGRLDDSGPRVRLLVPSGARGVLDRLAALFPVATFPALDRAFDLAFDVREYVPHDSVAIGGATLELHPLRHVAPNCGTRISAGGATVAYTGDTGVTDALGPLAADVDVLLAEATLDATDTSDHGHLSAVDAGRAAAGAGARSLVLTHFTSSEQDVLERRRVAAASVYGGPVEIAAPGRVFAPRVTAAVGMPEGPDRQAALIQAT
jgi:ribonuclease BN (tRNA processing enzyme)